MSSSIDYNELSTAVLISVCSLISLVSCIISLYTVHAFKFERVFQIRMIAALTWYDLFWSLGNLTTPVAYLLAKGTNFMIGNHPLLCNFTGWVYIYTLLGSIWWTSMICHQVHVAFETNKQSNHYYFKMYVHYGFIIPSFFATIPLLFNAYGPTAPFSQINCFIDTRLPKSIYFVNLYGSFFGPIWVGFAFNLWIIIKTVRYINSSEVCQEVKRQTLYLFIYPFIIFITWIVPTLSDVFFSTEQFPVWVGNLIFVLNTSIGFFNSLAYSGSALRYISVKKSLVDLQSIDDEMILSVKSHDDYESEIMRMKCLFTKPT